MSTELRCNRCDRKQQTIEEQSRTIDYYQKNKIQAENADSRLRASYAKYVACNRLHDVIGKLQAENIGLEVTIDKLQAENEGLDKQLETHQVYSLEYLRDAYKKNRQTIADRDATIAHRQYALGVAENTLVEHKQVTSKAMRDKSYTVEILTNKLADCDATIAKQRETMAVQLETITGRATDVADANENNVRLNESRNRLQDKVANSAKAITMAENEKRELRAEIGRWKVQLRKAEQTVADQQHELDNPLEGLVSAIIKETGLYSKTRPENYTEEALTENIAARIGGYIRSFADTPN